MSARPAARMDRRVLTDPFPRTSFCLYPTLNLCYNILGLVIQAVRVRNGQTSALKGQRYGIPLFGPHCNGGQRAAPGLSSTKPAAVFISADTPIERPPHSSGRPLFASGRGRRRTCRAPLEHCQGACRLGRIVFAGIGDARRHILDLRELPQSANAHADERGQEREHRE